MTYFYFSKMKMVTWAGYNDEQLIIFEQGCMGKPVCILDKEHVERLIKEWNDKTYEKVKDD